MGTLDRLVGATVIEIHGAKEGSDAVAFVTDRGTLRMKHEQDCCESVDVVDVVGDPNDLLGATVTLAEERDSSSAPAPYDGAESYTWTFYEIQTTKGDLTLRWLGQSNGYYSEGVDLSWENPS